MAQHFQVHPDNPQPRLMREAVKLLRGGAVMVYPTDSSYGLGCMIGNKDGMERIRALRQVDDKHHFTLICRDLSEIARYARVDNRQYRLLKAATPGGYRVIVRTDIFNQIHEGVNEANNTTASADTIQTTVDQLLIGTPTTTTTLFACSGDPGPEPLALTADDGPEDPTDADGDGGDGEDEMQRVSEPRQPAGDEVIALSGGEARAAQAEQLAPMMGKDAHRAIGPAKALFLEVGETVRHQAAPVGVRQIERLMAALEQA